MIGGLIVNPFEHANQLVRADDYVATIAITATIVHARTQDSYARTQERP
jgi:hypothetical protein